MFLMEGRSLQGTYGIVMDGVDFNELQVMILHIKMVLLSSSEWVPKWSVGARMGIIKPVMAGT